MTKFLDLGLEIGNRSFEIEKIHAHLRWRGWIEVLRASAHRFKTILVQLVGDNVY